MLTIQTREFVGLLTDVIPFAFPDDDLPDVNVIRLEWDGRQLHAAATDTMRAVRSTWDPDDDEDDGQEAMFRVLGGADDRWVVLVDLADAKELVKIYKLPAKESGTPITLDQRGTSLIVDRSRDTGHSAIKTVVESRPVNFPTVSNVLDVPVLPQAVEELHYTGAHLASFGLVRQRGPMTLLFQGPNHPTRVTVGARFVGIIQPQPLGKRRETVAEPTLEVAA